MISIAIPYYAGMKDASKFLARLLNSIHEQTFNQYEVVITGEGNASHNTNEAIRQCKYDIVKVMYIDDYFTSPDSLQKIMDALGGQKWLIAGSNNNQVPKLTGDIHLGNNKLGSPSALIFRKCDIWFDEDLKWLLDCDFYKKMWIAHGEPAILNGNLVTIGEGEHQATNLLSNKDKEREVELLRQRYVRATV